MIPGAVPSIITGAILASGRVFGEAAALLFTAGLSTPRLNFADWNPLSETSPLNIFRPAETLAVHIWNVNTQGIIPDAEAIANGASAVLVLSVLLFNLADFRVQSLKSEFEPSGVTLPFYLFAVNFL